MEMFEANSWRLLVSLQISDKVLNLDEIVQKVIPAIISCWVILTTAPPHQ